MSRSAPQRVYGGCINESFRWQCDQGELFVKIAPKERLVMLEAEAAGLEELRGANGVRVPRVLAAGSCEGAAYLALEWIDLVAGSPASAARLGEQLARQHQVGGSEFGWSRDNFIGSNPQLNMQQQDWPGFFRERRLRYQLDLAVQNGFGGHLQRRGTRLLEQMHKLFTNYRPAASLLHGDLWGGNWGADSSDSPVIFDPAVYYGDRETDLAMTRLFGGFGADFYRSYSAVLPLDVGAAARMPLYNLYHVLNHLNLFGAGYLRQAETMIESLLGEL